MSESKHLSSSPAVSASFQPCNQKNACCQSSAQRSHVSEHVRSSYEPALPFPGSRHLLFAVFVAFVCFAAVLGAGGIAEEETKLLATQFVDRWKRRWSVIISWVCSEECDGWPLWGHLHSLYPPPPAGGGGISSWSVTRFDIWKVQKLLSRAPKTWKRRHCNSAVMML